MDKYKAAIIEYEAARQSIIDCGKAIGAAGLSPIEWDGDVSTGGKSLCTKRVENKKFFITDTCIEHYWGCRKEAKALSDETGEDLTADDIDIIDMCPSCKEVDRLVMVRKKERQRFGIAKRRITQLGKGAG